MTQYFVETEHVRGEKRIYWVAKKTPPGTYSYRLVPQSVTEPTTSKATAERQCDRLNKADTSPHS